MEITCEPDNASSFSDEMDKLVRLAESPELMEGIGGRLEQLWRRAFDEPDLRPSPWAPRKDKKKTHPVLILSGKLASSPRVITFTANSVTLGSSRPYAAIHQFGGSVATRHTGYNFMSTAKPKQSYAYIPPRPSFPITADGRLTPRAEQEIGDFMDGWMGGYTPGGA